MSSESKVNDIMLIIERLSDVLERENAALKDRKIQEVHALLDDKVTLSRVYETRMQYYNENPDELINVSPELRDKLSTVGANISKLLQQNAAMLKVAIEANRKVVDMIAAAVKSATPGPGTYGSNGVTGLPDHKSQVQGMALSLDQTL
jgi:flagellar biosynthesis/type III secretory pathway chaperone